MRTLQKEEYGSFGELKIVENIWRVKCKGGGGDRRDERWFASLIRVCETFEPHSQDNEESQRNFEYAN